MVKKLLMAVGAIIALIVVLVIVAGVVIYLTVDKAFVETKMASALNRQVSIEKINVSLLSAVSGIEVRGLSISNFKTPDALARLQGQPVDPADLLAGMEAMRFKVQLLPLLKREVQLRELVFYKPVINLSRNKQGVLNIDDLIQPRPQDESEGSPRPDEPRKPLSADQLPMSVEVGEIGMRDGTINFHDAKLDQTFQVYNLTTLLHDIRIDPKDLAGKNEIKVTVGMGVKTIGAMKTGSVQSFDVTVDATGRVIPFDLQSRVLDPEVLLKVSIPDGEITGLQIFNAVAAIPILGDYLGQYIGFLRGTQKWQASRQSGMELRYKGDEAEITRGRLDLSEASFLFDGRMNLANQGIAMNLDMIMIGDINEAVLESLAKRIDGAIRQPEIRKYADPQKLAGVAMQPLLNDEGRIAVKTNVGGTIAKPVVRIVRPQLDSVAGIVTAAAASVVVEAGKEVVKDAAKQMLNEDQQKLLEDVGGFLKRQ